MGHSVLYDSLSVFHPIYVTWHKVKKKKKSTNKKRLQLFSRELERILILFLMWKYYHHTNVLKYKTIGNLEIIDTITFTNDKIKMHVQHYIGNYWQKEAHNLNLSSVNSLNCLLNNVGLFRIMCTLKSYQFVN